MRKAPFILALAAALASCGQERGAIEEVVQMPRAQLYADLDAKVSALEQAVTAKPTQTGTPPVPVDFDFAHEKDRHLKIKAVAGFRVVTLELFLEDAETPGQTRLSANVAGMSDADAIKPGSLYFPVEERLTSAVNQANEGVRIAALFGEGGDPRWCWCQFWRLRAKDFSALKVPQLRERLHDQARSDRSPGLVAFDGDRAVGWVSLGPRTDFERIVRSKVIPTIDDRPVWSIVCFAVSPDARGRGVGAALLDAAIEHARSNGADALEAYPVRVGEGETINAESAFTGTLPMFERLGFRVVADRASDPSSSRQRVVVRKEL